MAGWFRRFKIVSSIFFIIFGIVLALLVLFGLWKFGSLLGFFLVYPWIYSQVTGSVVNPHLATIIALLTTAVLYFGVYRFAYKRNKNWGIALFIGLLILHSTFLIFCEKDRFYSMVNGKPIKFYTVNPINGEYQVFEREVYDAFGQKAKAVDFKVSQEIYRQQHSDQFPNQEIVFASIKNFFDPRTGATFVYYSQDPAGRYHFFLHQGFDPITGRKLEAVTTEVVEKTMGSRPTAGISGRKPSQNKSAVTPAKTGSEPKLYPSLTSEEKVKLNKILTWSYGRYEPSTGATETVFPNLSDSTVIKITQLLSGASYLSATERLNLAGTIVQNGAGSD